MNGSERREEWPMPEKRKSAYLKEGKKQSAPSHIKKKVFARWKKGGQP